MQQAVSGGLPAHSRRTEARRAAVVMALIFALLAAVCPGPARAAEKLTAERAADLVPQFFQFHLKERAMTPAFMKRLLKEFVNQIDPTKSFYLKPEADAVADLTEEQLENVIRQAKAADFSCFSGLLKNFLATQIARDNGVYDGLENRADEIKALAKEKPKTAEGSRNPAPEKGDPKEPPGKKDAAAKEDEDPETEDGIKWNERPVTHAEREARLLKAAAYFFGVNRSYMSDIDALAQALQMAREERKRWLSVKVDEEVPKLFLKSFMAAMDPHTAYMDAEEDEEFTSRLKPSFAGIGVQIRPCPLGAYVEDIIKGGPSERSGRLARGDQIVRVDDVVLAGLTINKIVKRIKGEKGTTVKLTILKRETKQTELVALVRDTINLGDMRVKGKKFETPAGPVGVIAVTTFYCSEDRNGVHTNGVTEDLRDRILSLGKDQPLAGLVIDLRNNHGGYLEEAVALAGLFITTGPVVGERDGRKLVDWKYDLDPGMVFAGPLVILANQFSASASEIVAGSLQDYGRAVIVSATQTFGKGTVQRVLPLSGLNLPGEAKITTHQYFLAGGASVQQRGVTPDVVIPGPKLYADLLEKADEHAMPWDSIPGRLNAGDPNVQRWSEWKKQNVAMLQEKSNQRVAAHPEIKDFFDARKRRAKLEAEKQADKPRRPDEPPPLASTKEDEKDPQADEAVAVAQDMAATWPTANKQAAK